MQKTKTKGKKNISPCSARVNVELATVINVFTYDSFKKVM